MQTVITNTRLTHKSVGRTFPLNSFRLSCDAMFRYWNTEFYSFILSSLQHYSHVGLGISIFGLNEFTLKMFGFFRNLYFINNNNNKCECSVEKKSIIHSFVCDIGKFPQQITKWNAFC